MTNNIIIENFEDCMFLRLASGKTNVLNTEVLHELSNAIEQAEKNARGVVLCGGDKFFSNGVDLDWALEQSGDEIRRMFLTLGQCILKLLETPKPVVSAIKGHAIGGAFALFISCDYRFGSTGRVLVGKPEILLGVPNPYFGDQLLRFVAGDFIASDLIYSGRLITAEEASQLNIIHNAVEPEKVEQIAFERLKFLIDLNPEAFSETKEMRNGRFCSDLRQQMSARVARQVEIWEGTTAQTKIRVGASKLIKRSRR